MKKIITIAFIVFVQTLSAQQVPQYSVDSVAGIVNELRKDQYEKPVKEWLKINRPAQYKAIFEEKSEKPEDDTKSSGATGILTALGELNAAVADFETLMIDYYINTKAQEGWIVVSLTDKMILFRRDIPAKGEQGGSGQPATRPEFRQR
jgi:hypothetical protein